MKAYIVVPYDIFPYYLTFECEDTGKDYKVCDGLYFEYSEVIVRLTKKQFQELEFKIHELKCKKDNFEQEIKKEAADLLKSFKA